MNARQRNETLCKRLAQVVPGVQIHHAVALARAQCTLRRWAELECGDGDDWRSWAIERDETTRLPYMCYYPHNGKNYRVKIADREKGALKRIATICKELGLNYYHQTDPRGCALYVSTEPLTDSDYTRGIACC